MIAAVVAFSAAAGGCGSSSEAASAGYSTTNAAATRLSGEALMSNVLLRPAQIARGYTLRQRPDGRGVVGFVTLDLCGAAFPSEQERTDRIQVNYIGRGASVKLSNEVVTYRPGGAEKALSEVDVAASHCPPGPVSSTIQGVSSVTYRLRRLVDKRLLPGYVALLVDISATVNGRPYRRTTVAVYQARGNVLSGVYTYTGSIPAQQRAGLHAAEQSAKNLRTS
jgi:hypothetical protein